MTHVHPCFIRKAGWGDVQKIGKRSVDEGLLQERGHLAIDPCLAELWNIQGGLRRVRCLLVGRADAQKSTLNITQQQMVVLARQAAE
ncbi:hypothetical protein NPIL_635791 [Nephila pilipes]|uniref:Uncharacterized protein n=1 Tax=Nephila pilipes TaxID=299642 RepID=A0A8X6MIT4_NEPPI|nr:hypothetical protein NPIL_635791 [Nephila pilipes]